MDGLLLPLALLILGVPLAGLFLGVASRRRLRELEARILALEFTAAQLRELARRGFAPVTAPEPGRQAPTPVSEPRPVPPSPEPARPSVFAQPPRPAAPAPPTPITPGRIDAGNGEDLGWRRLEGALGGTWLSRIGALAVTVGIGFFLKYAFDSGWIQPAGRVAMGVAAGMALLLAGERLQRAAYRVPAQALVASGVAALYLSVFAAYAFYQLITQPVAFGFMFLVTVIEAAARERPTAQRLWQSAGVIALAAPAAYFVAARAVMWPEHASWLALLCLVLAAYYVGLARATLGAPGVGPLLLVVHGAIALGFLTLTFPIQFAEHGTTIAWSVEGAALVWGGLRLRSGPLRIGGLIVLALGMARWLMIVADQPAHRGMFVADDPALVSTLVYIVATAIAARRYRTEGVRLTEPETYVRPTLAAVSAAAAGLFLATELHRHPALMSSALRSVTTTLVW